MESGGSGIATTQSHHQGRASKHEHGDASHVQQHGAHAAGLRQVGASVVHEGLVELAVSVIKQSIGSGAVPFLIVLGLSGQSDHERIGRQIVTCRSLGFLDVVLAIIETGDGELTVGVRLHNGSVSFITPSGNLAVLDLSPLAIGLTLQLELGVLQGLFIVSCIDLGTVQLVGEDDDLVFRGFALRVAATLAGLVRVVGEGQLDGVLVARQTDFGLTVQGRRVFDDDVLASGYTVNGLQIREGNGKILTVNSDSSGRGDVSLIGSSLISGNVDLDAILGGQGQAIGSGVVKVYL